MQKEKKKIHQTKWFLWLWLIFFPPVGIALLWACHKEMKKGNRVVLSAVFAMWFILLMVATKGGSITTPTEEPSVAASTVVESNASTPEDSESPKEVTKQTIEDACFSFFTDIVVNAYGEIPRGVEAKNGTVIDSTNLSANLKSGEVIASYTLEEDPHTDVNVAIAFNVKGERVSISGILVDGITEELPDDAKESVLIWLLLDRNYQE